MGCQKKPVEKRAYSHYNSLRTQGKDKSNF